MDRRWGAFARLLAGAMLLGVCQYQTAFAAKAPQLLLRADIDGDGKKDSFYRVDRHDKSVEVGVSLTTSRQKYIKVFDTSTDSFSRLRFSVETRREFLKDIACRVNCSSDRKSAIYHLERSKSPFIVHVYTPEGAGSAIFIDKNGEVREEFYSD